MSEIGHPAAATTEMGSAAAAARQSIEQLLKLLDIDEVTRRHGQQLWEILAPSIDAVLDVFYQKLVHAHVEPLLSDGPTIVRLKRQQKAHWASLFNSQFDERYINRVQRMGVRHVDVGLRLRHYVAAYMLLKIEFANVIVRTDLCALTKGLQIKTLDKYVALDMAIALSSYDVTIVD